MIVLNDLHIGTIRSAGTTPRSALALRQFLIDEFSKCVARVDEDLVLNGDLFDTYQIPMSDLLQTYQILKQWLRKGHALHLVPGNHDLSTDSSKLSSFEFMGQLLLSESNVQYYKQGAHISDDVYVIPHVPNQDLFDMELAKVPKCRYLLLHCNYDNNFAREADHSLNLSEEQAQKLPVDTIFFAHEHYYREALRGKVFIGGNQYPASISDCLHKEMKCMHRLGSKGVERIQTWSADDYCEMQWDDVQPTDARFIRFVGSAKPEQAVDVSNVIAQYRRASEAFIVGNAVRIGEDETLEKINVTSLEQVRAFDVWGALQEFLSPEEFKILESLK